MTKAAKTCCKIPACPLYAIKNGYCTKHLPKHEITNKKNDKRVFAHKRGYDFAWKKIRDRIVKKNPVCVICKKNKTEIIHHIPNYIPGTSHRNYELIPVCRKCHANMDHGDRGLNG